MPRFAGARRIGDHDRNGLGWRDIVARREIRAFNEGEIGAHRFRRQGDRISSAHPASPIHAAAGAHCSRPIGGCGRRLTFLNELASPSPRRTSKIACYVDRHANSRSEERRDADAREAALTYVSEAFALAALDGIDAGALAEAALCAAMCELVAVHGETRAAADRRASGGPGGCGRVLGFATALALPSKRLRGAKWLDRFGAVRSASREFRPGAHSTQGPYPQAKGAAHAVQSRSSRQDRRRTECPLRRRWTNPS